MWLKLVSREYFMRGGEVFAVDDSKASNGSVLKLYAFNTK